MDSIKVGDVVYTAWGTAGNHVEFFEVLQVRRSQVLLRKIDKRKRTHGEITSFIPVKNAEIDPSERFWARTDRSKESQKIIIGANVKRSGWPANKYTGKSI